jgi:hypothetical protein
MERLARTPLKSGIISERGGVFALPFAASAGIGRGFTPRTPLRKGGSIRNTFCTTILQLIPLLARSIYLISADTAAKHARKFMQLCRPSC